MVAKELHLKKEGLHLIKEGDWKLQVQTEGILKNIYTSDTQEG